MVKTRLQVAIQLCWRILCWKFQFLLDDKLNRCWRGRVRPNTLELLTQSERFTGGCDIEHRFYCLLKSGKKACELFGKGALLERWELHNSVSPFSLMKLFRGSFTLISGAPGFLSLSLFEWKESWYMNLLFRPSGSQMETTTGVASLQHSRWVLVDF